VIRGTVQQVGADGQEVQPVTYAECQEYRSEIRGNSPRYYGDAPRTTPFAHSARPAVDMHALCTPGIRTVRGNTGSTFTTGTLRPR
jgi:hypothetical protein